MLKNYFKIAIAILKRRKFFTFISLFGISFTLMILMVLTAFIDKVINDKYPDKKRDRLLYVNGIELRGKESMNSSALSYYFLTHYVGGLKTPEMVAISSTSKSTNTYVNDRKIVINYKYTNAAYWDVLDYDFSEGKAITKQQIDNGEMVTVISETIKKAYFGNDSSPVVGKYIEADNLRYRICGVFKSLPVTTHDFFADIYLPITTMKTKPGADKSYTGGYKAVLMAKSPSDVEKMAAEYEAMVAKLPMPSKEFDHINSHADTYLKGYVRTGNETKSGMLYAISAVVIFTLFVMLLPTLNLININITRIMERSSEIGVRKAFGASSKTLVWQFIVENMILTLLGGLLGVVFSALVLYYINHANFLNDLGLSINFTVLFYALFTCVFFGLLSGVYPAWRMSKLNIVKALKAN